MELLFTSDLHGSQTHYEQLLELLGRRPCDVLILGGDMHPDGDRGIPYKAVCNFLRGYLCQWLQRAHEQCPDLTIFAVLGNHDWTFTIDEINRLAEQQLLVMLTSDQIVEFDGWKFLGLSHCPPAPYWIKDFERRDLTADAASDFGGYVWSTEQKSILPVVGREYFAQNQSIEQMLEHAPQVGGKWILVSHAPPADGNLDLLSAGLHVGSKAVRRYIEKSRPILTLHGHIHESPRETHHVAEAINSSLCVNAGQEEHRLCAVWWNSDRPKQIEHTLGYQA